jgi:hypothetical protein
MREKLKISSEVLMAVTVVVRNANEAAMAPVVGSGGVSVWQGSGVNRSEGFSYLVLFTNKFCRCCTFSAICKNSAEVNAITARKYIPVNFDGSYYASSVMKGSVFYA